MANALRKLAVEFGLAEDNLSELDIAPEPYVRPVAQAVVAAPEPARMVYPENVTPLQTATGYKGEPAAADLQRITTIQPRTYNDAKLIGEAFRSGLPVIMNISELNDEESKRLVDFSCGLVFGLRGRIERVTGKVWVLSPEQIQIIHEDEIQVSEASNGQFYNQS